MDDSRTFLRGLRKGVRWVDNRFIYDPSFEAIDILENCPDDARNTNLLLEAMNTIMDFLTFTGESPSDFSDNRLPTLDCAIYVKNGTIFHSFFEKSIGSDRCLDANTALAKNTLRSSLRQEIVRRLTNIHLETPVSERNEILDRFYVKLTNEGQKQNQY